MKQVKTMVEIPLDRSKNKYFVKICYDCMKKISWTLTRRKEKKIESQSPTASE